MKRRTKQILIFVAMITLVMTLLSSSAGAATEDPSTQKIRVGLCYGSNSTSNYTLTTKSGGFEYGYSTGKEFVLEGETSASTIIISSSGNQKLSLLNGDGETITTFTNQSGKNFAVRPKNDGLTYVKSPSKSDLNYDYYGYIYEYGDEAHQRDRF